MVSIFSRSVSTSQVNGTLPCFFYRVLRTFIAIGAVLYNLRYNYSLTAFKPSQKSKVLGSIILSMVAQSVIVGPILMVGASWFAVFHFWIFPVLVCNTWIAIHTFVQHTAEDSVYYEPSKWTPYKGQVKGTINCYFPNLRAEKFIALRWEPSKGSPKFILIYFLTLIIFREKYAK